ncbi:hypothetical protein E2C01_086876 [Portunus trituberculatus]|uniref:Uncharacterized protein n=1 Tax=Portunus trituberculatus TaxID=210409 RepID=A0A5B7JCL0_PORTR|nr:hypothetical protein [Portunus trituberculatus]
MARTSRYFPGATADAFRLDEMSRKLYVRKEKKKKKKKMTRLYNWNMIFIRTTI